MSQEFDWSRYGLGPGAAGRSDSTSPAARDAARDPAECAKLLYRIHGIDRQDLAESLAYVISVATYRDSSLVQVSSQDVLPFVDAFLVAVHDTALARAIAAPDFGAKLRESTARNGWFDDDEPGDRR